MPEADAERRVCLRLQREETTRFASSLAGADEAHALEVEMWFWFKRTHAAFARVPREPSSAESAIG